MEAFAPRPTHRAALALVAVVALTAGCSTVADEGATPPPDPETTETSSPEGTSTSPSPEGAVDFLDIPDLVQEVAPSTVSIAVLANIDGRQRRGAGSGVIWSSDGIIVTNAHVVLEATEIEVILADGERVVGEVLAADPRTDLAAVSIDRGDLPAATFTDTLPRVGELAIALGNPLGFENTATAGIVSGVERSLPVSQGGPALVGLIQTDASISSGNSGGALVNGRGQVMGINVAALGGAPTGVAENVGFAIPAPTVTAVVTQLVEDGQVAHPYLGIGGAAVTPQIAERFGLPVDQGVIVRAVEPDGPAAQAGIAPGEVIVAIDDSEVASLGDLLAALRQHRPGDSVEVTLSGEDGERQVEVRLGELPEQPAPRTGG